MEIKFWIWLFEEIIGIDFEAPHYHSKKGKISDFFQEIKNSYLKMSLLDELPDLPEDVEKQIIAGKFLSPKEKIELARVSKHWRRIIESPYSWPKVSIADSWKWGTVESRYVTDHPEMFSKIVDLRITSKEVPNLRFDYVKILSIEAEKVSLDLVDKIHNLKSLELTNYVKPEQFDLLYTFIHENRMTLRMVTIWAVHGLGLDVINDIPNLESLVLRGISFNQMDNFVSSPHINLNFVGIFCLYEWSVKWETFLYGLPKLRGLAVEIRMGTNVVLDLLRTLNDNPDLVPDLRFLYIENTAMPIDVKMAVLSKIWSGGRHMRYFLTQGFKFSRIPTKQTLAKHGIKMFGDCPGTIEIEMDLDFKIHHWIRSSGQPKGDIEIDLS